MGVFKGLFHFLRIILFFILFITDLQAGCPILTTAGTAAPAMQDALSQILAGAKNCPRNVLELRALLLLQGLNLIPTMVTNRGFHNNALGSFSFFEMVEGELPSGLKIQRGDFFFGHFTALVGNTIVLNQTPEEGNLMIELIVRDPDKGYYNFYEQIGNGSQGAWFYRGDSADILNDIQFLHRPREKAQPIFGSTLRCSGCHLHGGPIMKEIDAPHNDWWTKERGLLFEPYALSAEVAAIVDQLANPNVLADAVREGQRRLEYDSRFQKLRMSRTLQEILRPLFAPVELNLKSDRSPLASSDPFIRVPSEFFLDPRLGTGSLIQSKVQYLNLLRELRFAFPESLGPDADHAWLAPVKAFSDQLAVEALVARGFVDQEFVTNILSVDFTNPVFSAERASLLKLLPLKADENWKQQFLSNVRTAARVRRQSTVSRAAKALLRNMEEGKVEQRAVRFLTQVHAKLRNEAEAAAYIKLLHQRRREVKASEISQNRLGQILEPGFRVIFAESPMEVLPGQLELLENGEIEDTLTCPALARRVR